MVKWFIFSQTVALLGTAFSGSMSYENISPYAKCEICNVFVENVSSSDLEIVRSRPSDWSYTAFSPSFCSEECFRRMRHIGCFPCYSVYDCIGHKSLGPTWFVDYGSVSVEVDFMKEQEQIRNMAYRPVLLFPQVPLLALVGDAKDLLPLSTNETVRAYCVNRKFAFAVDGLSEQKKSIHSENEGSCYITLLNRQTRRMNEQRPPVTLSRLEATEVVYVTALCRKKVSSLAEFNEKIVKGDTAGFMVDLKNPVCETAIGSHLYQAAKRGNLIVSPQEKE